MDGLVIIIVLLILGFFSLDKDGKFGAIVIVILMIIISVVCNLIISTLF